ncbi:MAG: TadE-like protein [Chloroflexota bacterium]|jgi:Flp pilus assembly protein TadG|nr:TadE-like protein [Chloroflexota bacterium]
MGGERAQSMVEFALVGPLFLLLILMIVEGGLFMNAQASVDNATREAARAVSVCGSATNLFIYGKYRSNGCAALAQSVAQDNLGLIPRTGSSPPSPVYTVVQANGFGAAGSVTTDYSYTFYVAAFLGLGGPTLQMTSTAPVQGQQ